MDWIHASGRLYWLLFVASFLAVAIWESFRPVLDLAEPAGKRWGRHSLLLLASTIFSTALIPLNPVLLAASLNPARHGLLNQSWTPMSVRWLLAVALLDLSRYAAHRALHSIEILWRVHQVHHSDRDFDVSTGGRAHPIEVLFFHGIYLGAVAILMPPPGAVLSAQLLSVFETFFSHANAVLPPRFQTVLGWFLFSANTHRVHHCVDARLQNTNFGDIFPWWDRIFGTYSGPAKAGEALTFGLAEDQTGPYPGFASLLKQPFLRRP